MKLGILGGGQLARMMALAAYPLNIQCAFLDPAEDACAGPLGELFHAAYDDENGLKQLGEWSDCVAFEFETVPADVLKLIAEQAPHYPSYEALLTTQDRLIEKNYFKKLGIETAPFEIVDSISDLESAVNKLGRPSILKSRRLGYDGKGQVMLRDDIDLSGALDAIGKVPAILEGFVNFDREVSVIAVRARDGETKFYPLVENIHQNGILHISTVLENDSLQHQAEGMVKKLLDDLDYVGVLTLELFIVGNNLYANEYAPRVHNSGHWTIEGATISQFENHIRAVCGLPLGDTSMVSPSAMINLIGSLPDTSEILKIPGAHLHLYDKQPRPGRKIGHVTVCASTNSILEQRVERVLEIITVKNS